MAAPYLTPDGITAQSIGVPIPLGIIIATTTKSNTDTAVPFNYTGDALTGKTLLLQADAACFVTFGTASTVTCTDATVATMGFYLAAREKVTVYTGTTYGWVACLSVSGTTNLKVWQLV
jgi:hypothetical protein